MTYSAFAAWGGEQNQGCTLGMSREMGAENIYYFVPTAGLQSHISNTEEAEEGGKDAQKELGSCENLIYFRQY